MKKSIFFPTIFYPNQFLSLDNCVIYVQLLWPAVILLLLLQGFCSFCNPVKAIPASNCSLTFPKKRKPHFLGGTGGGAQVCLGRITPACHPAHMCQPVGELLPSAAHSSACCLPFPPQDAAACPAPLFPCFDKICIWDINSFYKVNWHQLTDLTQWRTKRVNCLSSPLLPIATIVSYWKLWQKDTLNNPNWQ